MMETQTNESAFFDWLSKQVSPAQLSDLYTVFSDINEFCLSRKVLKTSLFQTADISVLAKVRSTVESDKVFAFKYKKKRKQMIQGIHYYIRFVKETHPKSQETAPVELPSVLPAALSEEKSKPGTILDMIIQDNVPYIDNRDKAGCLWIVGGEELKPLVEKYKSFGVLFRYKESSRAIGGQPAWWTNDEIKCTSTTSGSNLDMMAKENRSEFISWMMASNIDSSATMMNLLYLKKCGEFACKAEYLSKDIFAIVSYEEIVKLREKLIPDRNFILMNDSCANRLIEAFTLFTYFLLSKHEEKTADRSVAAETAPPEETVCNSEGVPLVSELLSDELFAPLRSELARQGIKTVEDIKSIKLWQFMNRYNLYSIATRQTVLDKANAILNRIAAERPADLFKLFVGEAEYCGTSISGAYLAFCEYLAQKYPLRIRSLIGKKNGQSGLVAISKTDENGKYLKLTNPTAYIQNNLSQETVIQNVSWLFSSCFGVTPAVRIEEPAAEEKQDTPDTSVSAIESKSAETLAPDNGNSQNDNSTGLPAEEPEQLQETSLSGYDRKMIELVEKTVLTADLDGISYDGLHDKLDITVVAAKRYAALSDMIVEIKTILYHKDAIIDWDEGAEALDTILDKLMQKNNGYVSSAQLYDYARVEMNMFLNDNDMNDERAVFDMAQHLFSRVLFHGKRYYFMGKMHISKTSEAINSNFDVFCKFAADQGGVFQFTDLVEYLNGIGIKAGNLRAQLKLYTEPSFFYIEEGELISAASMQIDKAWMQTVKVALDKLFDDVGDHIILRDIQQIWFDRLPGLPQGRAWTPLLLQSILRFWGKQFNARTILAMGSQSMDTLHTMLVRGDSPIQNFGDAIISYILENGIDTRSFEAEELRSLLVGSRMIRGNELLNNMSKALSGDERFAWDVGGSNVTIRV